MNFTHPTSENAAESLAARTERAFLEQHARPPAWIVAAPGRVNLIGEHIDYNDGFVLPMAIERYVAIAAAPCEDQAEKSVSFHSVNLNTDFRVDLSEPTPGMQTGLCTVSVPLPLLLIVAHQRIVKLDLDKRTDFVQSLCWAPKHVLESDSLDARLRQVRNGRAIIRDPSLDPRV